MGEVNWILEADIVSFFDSMDRKALMEMLHERVADGSLLRLIGKCLHVGVLDGEEFTEPDEGTVQGSMLSPLLGNIYLHHVLDLWFERDVRPRLRGQATSSAMPTISSSASSTQDDAERVMEVLHKRMGRYGLQPAPGQDASSGLSATAERSDGRQGSGHLRLPRLHRPLAAKPRREPGAWRSRRDVRGSRGPSGRDRLVPTPSASSRSRSSTPRSGDGSKAT